MSLTPGVRLGPYEVLSPLGAGGMGEVYKARDTRLDRIVAIKISQDRFTERFEREARTVATLSHPHVCTLYDVGPNYLVMEYIEGEPVKGPLPLNDALKQAVQICDGLDAAHRKGITHRDLKPGNILVAKSGVKILDFGLAKIEGGSAGDELTTQVMTQAGVIVGTLQYASPEQLQGRKTDARSDIFSFGLVLYEMLTGQRAFDGSSPASVIAAVLERPAPSVAAVASPAVDRVLQRCLAKDPDERWQTVRDLKAELEWIAGGTAATVAPGAPKANRWRERAGWFAALVVLGASVFLARSFAPAPAGEVVSFAIYPPEGAVFSSSLNTTVSTPQFAVSPDGRTIVFAATMLGGARSVLWRRPVAEVAAQVLPGTEDAVAPFWSPDGRWVAFFSEGQLKKIPAAGGPVQPITQTATDFRGATWGSDDTILFGSGTEAIRRVSASGGPVTSVTVMDASSEGSQRYPSFLPDGRHFLYTISGSPERTGVYMGSLDGTIKKRLIPATTSAVYARSGHVLFVEGDALLAQAFDVDRLDVSGQPFLVAERVGRSSAFQAAISVSGTNILAFSKTLSLQGLLTWFDRSGTLMGSADVEGDHPDFRVSPDERLLAASLLDPKTSRTDVWISDLERGSRTKLTRGGQISAAPLWSPDSAKVVFRTNRSGATELYRRSAGGSGDDEPVLAHAAAVAAQIQSTNLVNTDWSPDGRSIVFSVPSGVSGHDLWLLPLTEGKPVKLLASPSNEMHGNFSPEGDLIAYTSNESGRHEVFVQTFPRLDRRWHVSSNGGYEPRWRADGREIYYLSEDRKLMAVAVRPGPSFDVPKPLFQTRVSAGVTSNRTHYVPSRDGQRFLINTQNTDVAPTPITVVLNWTSALKK
jgi:Tol biopolymer transport system component/predicted Ser/Thr protein kinase